MRAIPFVLMLLGSTLVQAESYGPTEQEMAYLPAYCGGPSDGVNWRAVLGEQVVWNNHTCYGINRINRYFRTSRPGERQNHLGTALQDLNYSVSKLPENFPLMPEILYYRGLVHKLMGKNALAMADWQKSIRLDKRYVKSIVDLADMYAQQKTTRGQALELVTEGLKDMPNSKALKNRYTRFGGKLPYPEARVSSPAPAQTPAVAPEVAPAVAPAQASAADSSQAQSKDPGAKPATVPADSAVQPFMGMEGNPWCRFCPEPGPSADPGSSKP